VCSSDLDEDNLVFKQYDSSGTEKLPVLSGKTFFHPFKIVENSQSNWYATYRGVEPGATNLSEEIFYARFNWIPAFSV